MTHSRQNHNATLLPDGRVVVIGGEDPAVTVTTPFPAELWNPTTRAWTTMDTPTYPRKYHSVALLLPDGRILAAGGGFPPTPPAAKCDEPGPTYPNAEIFSPPYLFVKGGGLADRPVITGAPATVVYGEDFLVATPDAADIAAVTWIRLPSVTHGFDQNQRFENLTFSVDSSALIISAPTNRNVSPPGHYMLFILEGGVPSIAAIIRITEPASINYPTCTVATEDFTDDPVIASVTPIRELHINELRGALKCARQRYSLTIPTWGAVGNTLILAGHITQLRESLNEVYQAAGLPVPIYAETIVPGVSSIAAQHINELRRFVRELPR
jgi:hypothetical protein